MRTLAIFALVCSLAAAQSTLHVPTGHATIQGAIVAAQPGDTVLVQPGTYVENLDFLGKDIMVVGDQGATVTIVDGVNGPSVARFVNGETAAARLEGFTLTNGHGFGGGILIQASSPTIRSCLVTGCTAVPGSAAGIWLFNSSSLIEGCTVTGNGGTVTPSFNGALPSVGGIGAFGSWMTLRDCVVSNNQPDLYPSFFPATFIQPDGVAGGLHLHLSASAVIEGCTFTGNTGSDAGGGMHCEGVQSVITIEDCAFFGNTGGSSLQWHKYAGAIHFVGVTATVRRSVFDGNQGGNGGFAFDGGTTWAARNGGPGAIGGHGAVTIESCSFTGNAGGVGSYQAGSGNGRGGAGAIGCQSATARHCTFEGNTGGDGADGTSVNGGPPGEGGPGAVRWADLEHCIAWGNVSGMFAVDAEVSGISTVTWSNVQGGFAGTGNIDADPLWDLSGDVPRLTSLSPCLDAGDPAFAPGAATDIDGDPRTFHARTDMGCDELVPSCFHGEASAGRVSVDGSDALVHTIPSGQPFTIAVEPPTGTTGVPFVLLGYFGVPAPGATVQIPGVGDLCLNPADPSCFVITSSFAPLPGQLLASTPAPWTFSVPGLPGPFTGTMQALTSTSAVTLDVTNAVVLEIP